MKKKMKKSFLFTLIGIIAVITIVGVGYAAWAIISPINIDNAGGSITAEELTDRTFTIDIADREDKETQNIHFGKSTVANLPTDAWFRDDGSTASVLTATLEIELRPNTPVGTNINNYLEGRTIDVMLATNQYAKFKTAIDSNYVAIPTITCNGKTSALTGDWASDNLIKLNIAGTDFTTTDGTVYTATVTLTFAYGTATEGMDPYAYYNQVNADGSAKIALNETNIAAAKAVCEGVYALNEATYTVSFAKVDAPAE